MSEYLFGLHRGHLHARITRPIERKLGVSHINYTEPRGEKRGWWAGPNLGEPFDRALSARVGALLDAA